MEGGGSENGNKKKSEKNIESEGWMREVDGEKEGWRREVDGEREGWMREKGDRESKKMNE